MLDSGYITMLIAMVGTTIAPWMQFYLQAAVVEKGITAKEYKESRIEVIVGCFMTSVIAFFIIVACAGAYRGSSDGYSERAGSGAGAEALRRICLPAVQRGTAQRFRLRRLHSAAFDGLFGLRRPGLRIRREQALEGSAHFLLAVYAADRGRRGDRACCPASPWCR